MRMVAAKLSVVEITFYFIVWTASVVYSSYHVYLAGKLFDHSITGDDFSDSWHGYKKDTADFEWSTWLPYILYLLPPWVGCHILLTEVTRWLLPQCVPAVSSLTTSLFLFIHFGPVCMLFSIFQVVVYYIILRFKSVALVWLLGIPFLLLSSMVLDQVWRFVDANDKLYTMMLVSITWLNLRCTSFCLELLSSKNTEMSIAHTFYNLLGYSFYFPTYFLGPFIIYSNFGPYMYRPFQRWTMKRVGTFLFNMLRYLFWAAFTEGSLYFLYVHALQYHMPTIIRLGEWTLYGLGVLMGLFFCLKYIAIYGLGSTVANFEGYVAPPPPKCILHIHLYTDMWRVFDVGYYQFLHKYIYVPLCAGHRHLLRRLMASAVCFSFVFLWHGIEVSYLIWSLLNFLGVSVVSFGYSLSKSATYRNWERRVLSETNSRRLTALLSAPMFIISVISAFYFFSGMKIGNVYLNQLFFHGTWTGLLTLLFVSYCMCQVSLELKDWEEARTKKNQMKLD